MSNQVVTRKKPKWSVAITQQDYQNLIHNTLNDPARANRFIASISSVVAVNPGLQDCDAGSVLTAALLGEALNLSPSPQLGQFYMIPFENALKGPDGKKLWLYDENGEHLKDSKGKWMCQTETKAQFVIGYKGLIQLAKRSGVYRHINVIEVKAGELESYNPFTEEIKVHPILNWEKRRELPTIGYGRIDDVFCDSAEQTLINTLRTALNEADLGYVRICNAWKTEINDRIFAFDMLTQQRRFFYVVSECDSLTDAICSAVWNPKSAIKNERLDDGTSDIDTMDAFEYCFERDSARLIAVTGRKGG